MAPERLGSGYGAIPPGDGAVLPVGRRFVVDTCGRWRRRFRLVERGIAGRRRRDPGGVADRHADLRRRDPVDHCRSGCGIDRADADQHRVSGHALCAGRNGGALPSGGDANKLLRGDGGTGLWTNVLPGTVYLGSTANALTAGGLSLNIGNVATSSSWNVTTRGGAGTTTFDISAGASGNPLSFGIACTPTAPGENADLFSFQHVPGANPNGYGNLTIITNASFWLPVSMEPDAVGYGRCHGGIFTGSIAASNINSGVIGTARLGTGTADNTKFLRGDGTWAVPSLGRIDHGRRHGAHRLDADGFAGVGRHRGRLDL